MEDSVKKIIIALELSADKYTKTALEAKKEIVQLNEAQKALKKSGNEASEQFLKNQQRLTELNKVVRDNNKAANYINQLNKENTTSTRDLSAASSILTKEYNSLTEEEKKNTQVGKDLGTTLASVNQQLRNNGDAVNDNRRNVGNYHGAISTLIKGTAGLEGLLGVLAGAFGMNTEAVKELTGQSRELIRVARELHHVTKLETLAHHAQTDATIANTTALSGNTAATEVSNDVQATGNVLTEENTVAQEANTAALEEQTVAQEALNVAQTGGIGLVVAVVAGVIAAATAIAQYIETKQKETEAEEIRNTAADGTIQMNADLVKSYNKYLDVMHEVSNEYRVMNGLMTEHESKIDNIKSKTSTKLIESINEERAASKEIDHWFLKAINMNLGLAMDAKDQIELMKKSIAERKAILLQEKQEIAKEDADNDKKEKEEAEKKQKEKEQREKKEATKDQEDKKKYSKELADLESKTREDRELAEADEYEKLLIIKSRRAEELKAIYEKSERKPADRAALNNQLLDLEKKYNNDVLELDIKAATKQLDADAELQKKQGDLRLDGIKKEIAQRQRQLDDDLKNDHLTYQQRQTELEKALAEHLITQEKFERDLTELKKKHTEERKKIETAAERDSVKLLDAYVEIQTNKWQTEINQSNELRDTQISNLDAQLAAGLISQSQHDAKVKQLQDKARQEEREIKRKQFKIEKEAAEIKIAINTAEGVTKALAESDPYTKAFLIAEAIAIGAAELAIVESKPVPAFAGGGISGKKITSTDGTLISRDNGDNLLATVRTGEVILNERQQAALGGDNTFRAIGVPGFADGGFAAGVISAPVESRFETANNLILLAKMLPTPVVLVEDINSAQDTQRKVELQGTI